MCAILIYHIGIQTHFTDLALFTQAFTHYTDRCNGLGQCLYKVMEIKLLIEQLSMSLATYPLRGRNLYPSP